MPFSPDNKKDLYEKEQEKRAKERHEEKDSVMTDQEREKIDEIQDEVAKLTEGINIEETPDTANQKREQLQSEIASIENEIEEFLEAEDIEPEARKQVRAESLGRLRTFVERRGKLKSKIKQCDNTADEIVQSASESRTKVSQRKLYDSLQDVHKAKSEIEKKLEQLKHSDPESFIADALYELRENKEELKKGIVETDYVERKKDQVLEGLAENRIAALMGETGTGKTILAEKIAQEISGDSQYEFVGGHAHMTKEDLFGYLGLKPEEVDADEVPDKITQAQEQYREEAPENIDKSELQRAEDLIEATVQGQAEQKQLQTEAIKGPILKAAKEGRPVIIDEFNYIPADLISGINQLLIADPGDTVSFLDDEVEVTDGFNVLFTGNMTTTEFSSRYEDREDVDPALVNRINSGWVEYGFVPQSIEATLDQSIIDRTDFEKGADVPNRELFEIGLTKLVDQKGNLEGKTDTLEQLWDLTGGISLLQHAYLGKAEETDVEMQTDVGVTIEDYPISMRDYLGILEDWEQSNFNQAPDYSIFKKLIRPASSVSPQAAGKMFYLLQERLGFFQDEVWDPIDYDLDTGDLRGIDEVEQNKEAVRQQLQKEGDVKFFEPKDVAEAYQGVDTPPLTTEEQEKEATNVEREFVLEVQEQIDSIEETLDNFEDTIERFCEDEKVILGEDE